MAEQATHFDGWKGPAIIVCLVGGIFWTGYSYYQLNATYSAQAAAAEVAILNGNRITALEENSRHIRDDLSEIKNILRSLSLDRRENNNGR